MGKTLKDRRDYDSFDVYKQKKEIKKQVKEKRKQEKEAEDDSST